MVLPWSTCVGARVMARLLDGVLLADAASHVRDDRDVAEALERRCSHAQRLARAELPGGAGAQRTSGHERPRRGQHHYASCSAFHRLISLAFLQKTRRELFCCCPLQVFWASQSLNASCGAIAWALQAMTKRCCHRTDVRPSVRSRTDPSARLYRSMIRINEPRVATNENSQRGPRPRVGIVVGHGERTQVNDSKLTHRLR